MTTRRLIRISYFTMLTVIGSLIKIPTGFMTLTFQTFFVVLSGLVLGGRDGAFSQIAFLVLGLVGLPVFTEGGGFAYVLRPSFGFIIGFTVGSFAAGYVMSRFRTLSVRRVFFAGLMGLLPIYAVGLVYQVIIYMTVNGFAFPAAMATLAYAPALLVKDAAMLFLLSLFYPRIMTMIGSAKKQKLLDNGMGGGQPVEGGEAQIAAAKDKKWNSDKAPDALPAAGEDKKPAEPESRSV